MGMAPIWDFHTTLNELIDLLIESGGGFGKLHFLSPEKSNPHGALPWRGVGGVVIHMSATDPYFSSHSL